jgi:DNA-binding MarR family transcriptional regulator
VQDAASEGARREALVQELLTAGREHSDVIVMFHAAVAERLGLSPTDSKALSLLERHGPIGPGELARLTGLAPASVTGLLNRLERRGLLHRTRDAADGRRQLVEPNPVRVPEVEGMFEGLVRGLSELYRSYSDAELEVVLRWHREATAVQRAAVPTADAHHRPDDREG